MRAVTAVTFEQPDGIERALEVEPGTSLMQAAVANGIRGIVAECGGQMMCATCHVYVEDRDGELPGQSQDEMDMLDLAAAPVNGKSRLSCQLVVGPSTRTVRARIPEVQV